MWDTTSLRNQKTTAIALSMMCFNTHAAIDVDSVLPAQYEVTYSSNIAGEQWSSVGISELTDTDKTVEVLSIADIVDLVKVALGLPNKDVARIFGVSRQTLHSYKNAADEQTVNAANQKRALTLAEIISEISPKFNRSPGAMAKNYTVEGKSLLDLLSEPSLKVREIVWLSEKLAEKMNSNVPKLTETNEVSLHQLTKLS
ncbi:helix-turn-helix domain-containing protein [Shewanella sp. Isolate7]|uniref:helix-turn-helix domain-containing protein n=1 Tax=Shewanella sp. Isolate7 TaxID=2908528 RepID=UPI001EFCD774|nr:helix-turn-helix domain-containing protein [Shewanella sp. Isolate7]MCG9723387.1 helix-turn-helix domain-containing protein [Shewanella sp. Isolate7]